MHHQVAGTGQGGQTLLLLIGANSLEDLLSAFDERILAMEVERVLFNINRATELIDESNKICNLEKNG